jgi:hypothetical protein
MSIMERATAVYDNYAVDVVGNLANIKPINYKGMAGGRLYVSAGSPLTLLTFYDAKTAAATFLPAQDTTAGTPVTMAVGAGKSYDLPAALYGAGALKIVGNAAGTLDGVVTKG